MPDVEPSVRKTPAMRYLPQIAVTTTPKTSERCGTRFLFIESGNSGGGATKCQIAFSFKRTKAPQTSYITQPFEEMYKYEAPKGFKFVFVFVKTDAGTTTLDILASEVDFEKVR